MNDIFFSLTKVEVSKKRGCQFQAPSSAIGSLMALVTVAASPELPSTLLRAQAKTIGFLGIIDLLVKLLICIRLAFERMNMAYNKFEKHVNTEAPLNMGRPRPQA